MIIAVDVGTYKIRAAAFSDLGEIIAHDSLVSDIAFMDARDMSRVSSDIATLVSRLESVCQVKASKVLIILSDKNVGCKIHRVGISTSGEVTESDKQYIVSTIRKAMNQQKLHQINTDIISYQMDDGSDVEDPMDIDTNSLFAKCVTTVYDKDIYNAFVSALRRNLKERVVQITSANIVSEYYVGRKERTAVIDIGSVVRVYIFENRLCTEIVRIEDLSSGDLLRSVPDIFHNLSEKELKKAAEIYCDSLGNDVVLNKGKKKIVVPKSVIAAVIYKDAVPFFGKILNRLEKASSIDQFVIIGGGAMLVDKLMVERVMKLHLRKRLSVVLPHHRDSTNNTYGSEWSVVFAGSAVYDDSSVESEGLSSLWFVGFAMLIGLGFIGFVMLR